MVEAIDVATSMGRIIHEVADYATTHRARFGHEPETGSPAEVEVSEGAKTMTEARRSEIRATYEQGAGILLPAAGQLLFALEQLLQPQMALFGFQAVTRALAEVASKSWWLMDPDTVVDVRLARLFTDNLVNIEEMVKVGRKGGMDDADANERKDRLVTRAAAAGVAPDYNDKVKLVGFGGIGRLNRTAVVGDFFSVLGFNDGEFWYRSLSAVCHGTSYGLLDYFALGDSPVEGRNLLAPRLPVQAVLHAAVLAMQSYLGALEVHTRAFGWDSEDVRNHRVKFLARMVAVSGLT